MPVTAQPETHYTALGLPNLWKNTQAIVDQRLKRVSQEKQQRHPQAYAVLSNEAMRKIYDIVWRGDLYMVLGVAYDATAEDLKKAKRRRFLMTHPDKRAEFTQDALLSAQVTADQQRVNHASDVLCDQAMRRRYDKAGRPFEFMNPDDHEHSHESNNADDFFADLFSRFFNGGARRAYSSGSGSDNDSDSDEDRPKCKRPKSKPSKPAVPDTIVVEAMVSLSQLLKGGTVRVTVDVAQRQRSGDTIFAAMPVSLKFPARTAPGPIRVLTGRNGGKQVVQLVVRQTPLETWKCVGRDLHGDKKVDPVVLLVGGSVSVKLPSGGTYDTIISPSKVGTVLTVKGYGLHHPLERTRQGSAMGDLKVTLKPDFPLMLGPVADRRVRAGLRRLDMGQAISEADMEYFKGLR